MTFTNHCLHLIAFLAGMFVYHVHLDLIAHQLFYRRYANTAIDLGQIILAVLLLPLFAGLMVAAVGVQGLLMISSALFGTFMVTSAAWDRRFDIEGIFLRHDYRPGRIDRMVVSVIAILPFGLLINLLISLSEQLRWQTFIWIVVHTVLSGSLHVLRMSVTIQVHLGNPIGILRPMMDELIPARMTVALAKLARRSTAPVSFSAFRDMEYALARAALHLSAYPFFAYPVTLKTSKQSAPAEDLFTLMRQMINGDASVYQRIEAQLPSDDPLLADELRAICFYLVPRSFDVLLDHEYTQALLFIDRRVEQAPTLETLRWLWIRLRAVRQLGSAEGVILSADDLLEKINNPHVEQALSPGRLDAFLSSRRLALFERWYERRLTRANNLRLRYLLGVGSEFDRLWSMAAIGADAATLLLMERTRRKIMKRCQERAQTAGVFLGDELAFVIGRRSIEERALALGDRSPAERIEEAHATLLELVELCEQPKLRLPDTKEVTLNDLPPLAKSLPGEVLAYAALTVRLAVMTADAAVKQTMVAEQNQWQKLLGDPPKRGSLDYRRERLVAIEAYIDCSMGPQTLVTAIVALTGSTSWNYESMRPGLNDSKHVIMQYPLVDKVASTSLFGDQSHSTNVPFAKRRLSETVLGLRRELERGLPMERLQQPIDELRQLLLKEEPPAGRLLFYAGFGSLQFLPLSAIYRRPFVRLGRRFRSSPHVINPQAQGTALWSTKGPQTLTNTREECSRLPNFQVKMATVKETIEALEGGGVVHLAGHAAAPKLGHGGAYIELEDGHLTSEMIRNIHVAAPLVYLSACETSMGMLFPGEPAPSLTEALLSAGAGMVVATKWRIPDDQSAVVAEAFWRETRLGAHPAIALHRARQALSTSHAHAFELHY